MHDPRLGRFFAVDPLTRNYFYLSSYTFAENSPISFIDLERIVMFMGLNSDSGKGIHSAKDMTKDMIKSTKKGKKR